MKKYTVDYVMDESGATIKDFKKVGLLTLEAAVIFRDAFQGDHESEHNDYQQHFFIFDTKNEEYIC